MFGYKFPSEHCFNYILVLWYVTSPVAISSYCFLISFDFFCDLWLRGIWLNFQVVGDLPVVFMISFFIFLKKFILFPFCLFFFFSIYVFISSLVPLWPGNMLLSDFSPLKCAETCSVGWDMAIPVSILCANDKTWAWL